MVGEVNPVCITTHMTHSLLFKRSEEWCNIEAAQQRPQVLACTLLAAKSKLVGGRETHIESHDQVSQVKLW